MDGRTGFWLPEAQRTAVLRDLLEIMRRQLRIESVLRASAPPGTRWPDHDDGDEGRV